MMVPRNDLHGLMGKSHKWEEPKVATRCDETARPGYNSGAAHEFLDTTEVLQEKIQVLAELFRRARCIIIYTGAGLSTASGVADYATKTQGLVKDTPRLTSPLLASPNAGHRAIAQLAKAKFVYRLVQQNHDGLPQKAGCPQSLINEIHGAWFDPSNPVVKMSGTLRSDLFDDLEHCAESADLVLACGTSLCGMNADRLVSECATRYASTDSTSLGSVIINLQRTPYDSQATLRLNGLLNDVLTRLVQELNEDIQKSFQVVGRQEVPISSITSTNVFLVPYDENGRRSNDGSCRQLDLREGAKLIIGYGHNSGRNAEVLGRNIENHWRIAVHPPHDLKRKEQAAALTRQKKQVPQVYLLGTWMIQAAIQGDLKTLPVISVPVALNI
mmetsp:Transcript_6378/g.8992  ORF Transcript_6378/g.8992 Transcript_6378/m.8992 type:complete len:386 (+) Transcript_6378:65-1222(+)|eukprot:CAMPEP_0197338204 /NCGR_PEP_ID=MMETSP0892-20130614/40570_1 /TAXON_ID=44058 ORGANISM="Aureoumbra lagunensis, Strain CCMP1510" /NCGR_SAMPLE_ID=MMETSP0892 /ASSEMBLY_ACC=CAM_ASM_000538 /LENGTH=385 /DNA_ID=CAMNT_0042841491 /DNA_START=16 /DNA_END=1173 /DNA_ORIENTATION=-